MDEGKKCSKCGSDAEYRIEGSTEGLFCTKCDWSVVTTYISKMAQDITQYKVFLLSADFKNKDHVKTVSKIANINLLQARKMIQERKPILFEGEAIEVDKIRNVLNRVGVEYDIEPTVSQVFGWKTSCSCRQN